MFGFRATPAIPCVNVENLLLRAPDGHLFPLKRVATLIPLSGEPEIMRDDLKRMVAVTGRISGRDLGSTVSDVKRALAKSGVIPNDVLYTFGGLYEQQQIAFRGLTIILIAAILLVFLASAFSLRKFSRCSARCYSFPCSPSLEFLLACGSRGTEFNITSRMGMTMIVGIVTEIAIFYYSEFRSLPASDDRLIVAGINRMRAISMTAFAAILALLPLALGSVTAPPCSNHWQSRLFQDYFSRCRLS